MTLSASSSSTASSSSSLSPRRDCRTAAAVLVSSEELVLSAEDLGDLVVGEDPADRVGQQVGAREHAEVVGRARAQRDGVGDDDLLDAGGREVLLRVAR